jgi:hypothetical protein
MSVRLAFAAAFAVSSAACAERHESQATDDGGVTGRAQAACTDGPEWMVDALRQGRWEDAGAACTPRCAATPPSPWRGAGVRLYGLDALPSGACAADEAPCNLELGLACGADPRAIWVTALCRCEAERWACEASYKGGGVCIAEDAGGVPADADVAPADCDGLDEASCDSRAGCTPFYALRAEQPQIGARYVACQRVSEDCHDARWRCATDDAGALWVHDACALPSGLSARSVAECSPSLPEQACEDLPPAECAAAAQWCRVLDGTLADASSDWVPLGCMTSRGGCTEFSSCARDGRGGPAYMFRDGCNPKGWEACPPGSWPGG